MISKSAVREFMSQPMESWDWLKDVPKEVLLREISQLGHTFKTDPRKHQAASFFAAAYNKEFLFFHHMGLGKTYILLNILSYLKSLGGISKTLILSPTLAGVFGWEEQITLHSNLSFTTLVGDREYRFSSIDQDTDLYLLNYAGLQVFMTEKKMLKDKDKMVPSDKKVREFVGRFNGVVYDESHNVANHESLTHRLCRRISRGCEYKYALTGTPFGRNLMYLWSQFYLVDHGKTLGETLEIYRSAFFDSKPKFWGGFDYKVKKGYEEKLRARIKNRSLRYIREEVDDIPPKVYNVVKIVLSEEARGYYENGIKMLIDAGKNKKKLDNSFVRLRQICSGFVQFYDDDRVRQTILFQENAKLEQSMDLIGNITDDEKVIVFNEFIPSGDIIQERLKKEKIGFSRLYSGTKDAREAVRKFKEDPRCKVFLVNSSSGSEALNLQCAGYIVFYESPVSPIVRQQAEERTRGSVFIYDLVATVEKSVEKKILGYVKEGKDLMRAILSGEDGL